MTLTRSDRIIDPHQQPDAHVDQRHGVITRRALDREQKARAKRPIPDGVAIGNGSVILGPNVRVINIVGAGVTVTVTGDVATITIP